ncbi:MAG TPA: hypothetical protein VJB06_01090 [archaeon]|nr:hypothetical protein [archaeon]
MSGNPRFYSLFYPGRKAFRANSQNNKAKTIIYLLVIIVGSVLIVYGVYRFKSGKQFKVV